MERHGWTGGGGTGGRVVATATTPSVLGRVERMAYARAVSDRAAAGAVHVERIPAAPGRAVDDVLAEYVGAVGLRPEDTYGVFLEQPGEPGASAESAESGARAVLCVAYRDHPGYASARVVWALRRRLTDDR